ncbi:MAG: hypothetical protein DME18_11415 [Verrucomicrobia bacterium]|nr:MAG: hypothetical protein DME18_11415 [Verrucomicrobiota bacterium]
MLNGCKSAVALSLLLGWAGCSSPPRRSSQLTRVPAVTGSTASASATQPVRPADRGHRGATNRPLAGVLDKERIGHDASSSVSGSGVSTGFVLAHATNDWISLETWSEANHFDPPQRLVSSTNMTCELHAPGGMITVTAGSHVARFVGIICWLGYMPRSADGHLLVHALDAGKNFLPLANPPDLPTDTHRVVVIDPGHGGENTGARSVADNHVEKEFTLDWALRLRPLLTGDGWKVVLTRTNDVDVSLADRVALADAAHADLFVSLHFNSGARQDQAGLETYCLTPTGMPSTLTRDYEDDITRVFPNNAFDGRNLQYAVRLHRALLEETGGVDRGVRRARFMVVLRGQNRPAVLVEGGYLSNPLEAQSIAAEEYRQKLAEAVAKALRFSNPVEDRTVTNAANQTP